MMTKFWVAALACLSMTAAAQQSDKKNERPTKQQVQSPRDIATGQASGRKMNQHVQEVSASGSDQAEVRESPSKASLGKTEVRESPSKASLGKTEVRESPTKASTGKTEVRESPSRPSMGHPSQVATGDLDGDGRADKTASKDSVKSPRDLATGQASGKRQHGIAKEQLEKSPRN